MVEYSLINFKVRGDHSGSLVALEKGEEFPFDIKRVYYIYGTQRDIVRGKHSHRKLEQVIICTSGSCDFIWVFFRNLYFPSSVDLQGCTLWNFR